VLAGCGAAAAAAVTTDTGSRAVRVGERASEVSCTTVSVAGDDAADMANVTGLRAASRRRVSAITRLYVTAATHTAHTGLL